MSQKRSETSATQGAFKKAQVLSVKEPPGLSYDGGKRQGGVTLLPRAKGKPLARDVSVPDTYADSRTSKM